MTGHIVALLGAESTGKTTLADALGATLAAEGRRVAVVHEFLREFCDLNRRTPAQHEQVAIAQEQSRRIEAAASRHEIVIADTTALMTAVYSDLVFGDASLYPAALAWQRLCACTLLTAIDLPWQADGLQRAGPEVQAPVDDRVRAALQRVDVAFSVIGGRGPRRLDAALAAVRTAVGPLHAPSARQSTAGAAESARWQWACVCCGDPDSERRLFAAARAAATAAALPDQAASAAG